MRKPGEKDILKYEPLINKIINQVILKNWNNLNYLAHQDTVSLGQTGYTVADIRQDLRLMVWMALLKYNPNKKNKDGIGATEFTYVHTYVKNRALTFISKFTKDKYGYGIYHTYLSQIEYDL